MILAYKIALLYQGDRCIQMLLIPQRVSGKHRSQLGLDTVLKKDPAVSTTWQPDSLWLDHEQHS